MLYALQAGHYMERAKRGDGGPPGSPELLQSTLQQAQRLLTRVWEWLCSLFGYRWQSPQEYQVLYRANMEGLQVFCRSVLYRHEHAAIHHQGSFNACHQPRYETLLFLLVHIHRRQCQAVERFSKFNLCTFLHRQVSCNFHLGGMGRR